MLFNKYLFVKISLIFIGLGAFSSPLAVIPQSRNAYYVETTSFKSDKVVFKVLQVIGGKKVCSLVLNPIKGANFSLSSVWLLLEDPLGKFKNTVGFGRNDLSGWIVISVSRVDNRSFVRAYDNKVDGVVLDETSEGVKGLWLDNVKRFLAANPK